MTTFLLLIGSSFVKIKYSLRHWSPKHPNFVHVCLSKILQTSTHQFLFALKNFPSRPCESRISKIDDSRANLCNMISPSCIYIMSRKHGERGNYYLVEILSVTKSYALLIVRLVS